MTRLPASRCKVLLAILVALTAAKQPASITDQPAFERAIAAIRADANSYDKFKEPVAIELIGKSFAISMPVQDDIEGQGVAYFDYKDGKLILNVSPLNAWPRLDGPSSSMPVLIVNDGTRMTGSYIGQNAFGVTARVRNFRNISAGIAIVGSPKPMLSPMRAAMKSRYAKDTDWWVSMNLPPSEARALALNTQAVVQGTYTTLPSGKAGFCHSMGLSATLDSPSNYHTEQCFIGAKVTRIALVNKATGAVLKEWTTAGDPILGPELWGGIRAGMNKYEMKSAQPAITDYGYFEVNGLTARVEMMKEVASKVMVTVEGGATGQQLIAALTQRHGQPVISKCISRLCEAKWRVNGQVDAYLSITGEVTYQLSTAEPPFGFSP